MTDFLSLALFVEYPVPCALVLGLMVGSFLNVVIHRLPVMMKNQWEADIEQYLEEKDLPAAAQLALPPKKADTVFNLWHPGSRCPHCNTPLRLWHNIPVISYLLLKGRCGFCGESIAWRYPVVEIVTGGLFALAASQVGSFAHALPLLGLVAALITLAMIDLDTYLLPDDITLPLMWAGFLYNMSWGHVALVDSVAGAMAGYLSLWLVYHGFKKLTGKEGMGYGDFKLLAALGAWFGWMSLPSIILFASLSGAVIGIGLIVFQGRDKNHAIPFGPWLVLGGLAWLYDAPGKQFLSTAMGL